MLSSHRFQEELELQENPIQPQNTWKPWPWDPDMDVEEWNLISGNQVMPTIQDEVQQPIQHLTEAFLIQESSIKIRHGSTFYTANVLQAGNTIKLYHVIPELPGMEVNLDQLSQALNKRFFKDDKIVISAKDGCLSIQILENHLDQIIWHVICAVLLNTSKRKLKLAEMKSNPVEKFEIPNEVYFRHHQGLFNDKFETKVEKSHVTFTLKGEWDHYDNHLACGLLNKRLKQIKKKLNVDNSIHFTPDQTRKDKLVVVFPPDSMNQTEWQIIEDALLNNVPKLEKSEQKKTVLSTKKKRSNTTYSNQVEVNPQGSAFAIPSKINFIHHYGVVEDWYDTCRSKSKVILSLKNPSKLYKTSSACSLLNKRLKTMKMNLAHDNGIYFKQNKAGGITIKFPNEASINQKNWDAICQALAGKRSDACNETAHNLVEENKGTEALNHAATSKSHPFSTDYLTIGGLYARPALNQNKKRQELPEAPSAQEKRRKI